MAEGLKLNFVFQPRKVVNWSEQFLSPSEVVTLVFFFLKRLQIRKKKQNPSALLKPKQYYYSRKQTWIIWVYMLLILTASPWWNCHHHHQVLQRSVSLSHIVIFASTICLVAKKILKIVGIRELYISQSQIWSSFSSSQREFKIRAVSTTGNIDASNYIPKAPIFLPEGPWKQVIIFLFSFFENIICIYLSKSTFWKHIKKKKSILLSLVKYVINVRNME